MGLIKKDRLIPSVIDSCLKNKNLDVQTVSNERFFAN